MGTLTYEVFVSDPPPRDSGFLPNGEPKGGSPVASTLILGSDKAVLTDPAFTTDQARALGDWIAAKNRKLTDIFITHGHGDHWFAAEVLAKRFGARVVATTGTIEKMRSNNAVRPLLWDKLYPGIIPPSPVTAVAVPNNILMLEGHELRFVEVGHSDTDDTSVLHVPDLDLVVAGDVIYNGVHMFLGESVLVGGFAPWREAIARVAALAPRHIVAGHQNRRLDDDATRTISETWKYLDDAEELLRTRSTPVEFFDAKLERYPDHLGRTVLWVSASVLYRVRERPGEDAGRILVNSWL